MSDETELAVLRKLVATLHGQVEELRGAYTEELTRMRDIITLTGGSARSSLTRVRPPLAAALGPSFSTLPPPLEGEESGEEGGKGKGKGGEGGKGGRGEGCVRGLVW